MEEKKKTEFLNTAFLLIVIKPAYDCTLFLLDIAGISLPLRMFHLYLMLMVYFLALLIKYKLPIKNVVATLSIILFYGVSYLWTTEQARQYFYNTDISALLLVCVPISFICVARISNWEQLFYRKHYLLSADVIIILSFVSKLRDYNYTGYMSFSYDLLPLWGMCLIAGMCYKRYIQWIFVFLGILEGVIFGARGPLVWLILLSLLVWITMTTEDINKKSFSHIVPGIIIAIVAVIMAQFVLPMLTETMFSRTSYVLKRIQGSSLFEANSRSIIYRECEKILADMGLNIHGLFFDRTVLPNGVYAHNFVLEILISLGWIIGLPATIGLIWFIIKTYMKQNNKGKIIAAYFCLMFFFRYFLSGSIFDEPKFWLFIAMMLSLHNGEFTIKETA